MITCRGLNMAKHLIVELEAVLLEKGKSSKDLVRGHRRHDRERVQDTPGEDARHQDGHPHGNLSRAGLPAGDILKIVTDEEFDRLVEERRENGEARVKAGLRRTAPERVYEIDLDLGGEYSSICSASSAT